MAASPKLLLMVCVTHKFAYFSTRGTTLLPCGAKSMYASSMTSIPLNLGYSRSDWMEERERRVPVGFPGEQRNMSLMDGSASIAFFIYMYRKNSVKSLNNKLEYSQRPSVIGISLLQHRGVP